MNAKDCPALNDCQKVDMILDKNLPGDAYYARAIRETCARCDGPKPSETPKCDFNCGGDGPLILWQNIDTGHKWYVHETCLKEQLEIAELLQD